MLIPEEGDKVEKYVPTPGYCAIRAIYLTGLMLPKGHEDCLAVFRAMPVHSRAGYSILIYRVEPLAGVLRPADFSGGLDKALSQRGSGKQGDP